MDDETQVFLSFLDDQRNHVLGILEGLSEEQLRQPVLPSGWTCLGMLQHLALGVEHYWIRCLVAGESLDFFDGSHKDNPGEWIVDPDTPAENIFALYRDEIARSNAIIAVTPLDTPPRQRDERLGEVQIPDLKFVILHMIEEIACHAGHLDVVRELLDGRQWMAL